MCTLYSDELHHPKQDWYVEEDYYRRTHPESMKKVPFRKKPKNFKDDRVFREGGDSTDSDAEREAVLGVGAAEEARAEHDLRGADFLSTEAVEAGGSTDEEEEGAGGEEGEGARLGEVGPTRLRKPDEGKPLSSCLDKFIDKYINASSYGTTFIAHNSGEGFEILCVPV